MTGTKTTIPIWIRSTRRAYPTPTRSSRLGTVILQRDLHRRGRTVPRPFLIPPTTKRKTQPTTTLPPFPPSSPNLVTLERLPISPSLLPTSTSRSSMQFPLPLDIGSRIPPRRSNGMAIDEETMGERGSRSSSPMLRELLVSRLAFRRLTRAQLFDVPCSHLLHLHRLDHVRPALVDLQGRTGRLVRLSRETVETSFDGVPRRLRRWVTTVQLESDLPTGGQARTEGAQGASVRFHHRQSDRQECQSFLCAHRYTGRYVAC